MNAFHPIRASGPGFTVSENPDLVTTIERFAVPPVLRDGAAREAVGHIARAWKDDPDFAGAVVLRSRTEGGVARLVKRGGVSCYARWRRPADGAGIGGAPPAERSLRRALAGFEVLGSRNYAVEFTGQAGGFPRPTRVSVAGTPCAHFGLFGVERGNQDAMLGRAREAAPKSLGSPGLLAINFHRSADGLHVANLGLWSAFDGFEALLDRPGFREGDKYYDGIARFEPDFFDVAAVETGPAAQA